ncbi:hypothetical protein BD310DRAFT_942399 [Dichomitus squalens]|uniref:Uncharacterized protein n=1 Tax=Dichomitus squalens TaxID=114155 RepID=A0A4Q9PBE5_9APHY|nr:hypothetical protein BD310DRAFT_942399 [Dichomitus squalens]
MSGTRSESTRESDIGQPASVQSEASLVSTSQSKAVQTGDSMSEAQRLRRALTESESKVETLSGRLQAAQERDARLSSELASHISDADVGQTI